MNRKGFAVEGGRRANLCNACGLHYRKGHFCKFCNEIYRDSSELVNAPEPWVTCPKCERWVHKKCLFAVLPNIEKQFMILNRVICDECMNMNGSSTTNTPTTITSTTSKTTITTPAMSTTNVLMSSSITAATSADDDDNDTPTTATSSPHLSSPQKTPTLIVDDQSSSSHNGPTTPVSSKFNNNQSPPSHGIHNHSTSPLMNHVVINPTSTSTAFAAHSGYDSNGGGVGRNNNNNTTVTTTMMVGRPQSFQHPTTPIRVAQRPFTVSAGSENVVSLLKRHNESGGTFLKDANMNANITKHEPLALPSIQNILNKSNF